MANYQVEPTFIDEELKENKLFIKTRVGDILTGPLTTGSLTLPGSDPSEMLSVTMANIKMYLFNLEKIAEEKREVSDSLDSASSINIASSKAVNDLNIHLGNVDTTLGNHATDIAGKAPIFHADSDLTYGGATEAKYGHVRLSNIYAAPVTEGGAENSMGASQAALYNAYSALNNAKAANDHANAAKTYGGATSSLYGHVKLTDTYNSAVNSGAADNSLGVSQAALYNAYHDLDERVKANVAAINTKAVTNHAVNAATYGLGTGGVYGHVKLSDGYATDNASNAAAAHGIAASSWALYRAYSTNLASINTKAPNTHVSETATSAKFSHVKLSDAYTSSGGGAANGVGASSLAVYNLYAWANGEISALKNSVNSLNSAIDTSPYLHIPGKNKCLFSYNAQTNTFSRGEYDSGSPGNFDEMSLALKDTTKRDRYLRTGFYIDLTLANGHHYEMFGNLDTYWRYGDTYVGHHIDFISKDLIPNSHGWLYRNENTNNGTAAVPVPFLSSMINTTINNYYGNLPANLRSHIIKKRFLHPCRYDANNPNLTEDNYWWWGDYNYLWLPTEVEIWGVPNWCTRGHGSFGSRRYPTFMDPDQIVKDDKGSGHARTHWWTASAGSGSTTYFCVVGTGGAAHISSATNPGLGVPLCFRFQ